MCKYFLGKKFLQEINFKSAFRSVFHQTKTPFNGQLFLFVCRVLAAVAWIFHGVLFFPSLSPSFCMYALFFGRFLTFILQLVCKPSSDRVVARLDNEIIWKVAIDDSCCCWFFFSRKIRGQKEEEKRILVFRHFL